MKVVDCEKCPIRNWCWTFFEKAKEYLEKKNIDEINGNLNLEDFCPLMKAFTLGVIDYLGVGLVSQIQLETLKELELKKG